MGTMRGGGMGMGMRAERTPHGRSARGAQADQPKRKIDLKKLWPQIRALVAPRKGLLALGLCLMLVNRVAGLVMPYTSKPLLDKVLSPNGDPALLPRIIALVFAAMVVQAITSFSLTQLALEGGPALDRRYATAGAEARGPAVGRLLRREPYWHAGGAHHERCGRRAQPRRHGTG